MAAALPRRGVLALALAGALGGCGFHPVYGRNPDGSPGPAEVELANITVSVIPGRPGMLLRQALQQRLAGDGSLAGARYRLNATFGIGGEGIAIQPDNSASRVRMTARSTWTLVTNTTEPKTIAGGSARAADAFNILDEQYFAADLESEVVTKRLAENIAGQIELQLASWFDEHPDAGKDATS